MGRDTQLGEGAEYTAARCYVVPAALLPESDAGLLRMILRVEHLVKIHFFLKARPDHSSI